MVKTFIIPIFLYRASLISVNKEFVKNMHKIISDFVWKGKDKVKRSALISDIEDGGFKAPHFYNRNAESSLLQEIGKQSTEQLEKHSFALS